MSTSENDGQSQQLIPNCSLPLGDLLDRTPSLRKQGSCSEMQALRFQLHRSALEDEGWKAKIAQAMWEKSGTGPTNGWAQFVDGTGEPLWASAEFMRITREMCLADLRKERLPKHNPYVGNFHRGISVSNASHPTWDLQVERMFAHNPYVGRVTRGEPSLSFKKEWTATSQKDKGKCYKRDQDADSDSTSSQCGQASKWTPPPAQEGEGHQTSSVMQKKEAQAHQHAQAHQQAQSNPQSNANTPVQHDPSDDTDKGVGKTSYDTRVGNTKRTRSFEDILDHRLSGCPETATLCGIQALLPRQAGLRVVKQVAEGSFAKVVLAINKRNQLKWTDRRVKRKLFHGAWLREGQRIVMKCIQKGISVEEDFAIEREVAVHGRLTHPNIASCYGYYEDTRHLVMLLDFVDGQELKDILRIRRSIAEPEASRVLLQAMRALAYLHAQQVVHRDISPRNCLVTHSGRLYLIDFGLAVDLLADLSHVAPGAGTMGYLAPEILSAQGGSAIHSVQVCNDVWSIGCILYEVVCGFAPFLPRDLFTAGGVQLIFPDENYGPVASELLQDLCRALLLFDPGKRLDAASAALHPWFDGAVSMVDDLIRQEDSYMQAGGEGEDMDAEEEEAGCETERSEGGGLEGAHASAHLKVAAHNVQGMPGDAAIRAHEEEVVVRAHVAEAATNKAGASFEDSGSPATLEDSGAGGNSGDEEAQVQVSLDLDFALPELGLGRKLEVHSTFRGKAASHQNLVARVAKAGQSHSLSPERKRHHAPAKRDDC